MMLSKASNGRSIQWLEWLAEIGFLAEAIDVLRKSEEKRMRKLADKLQEMLVALG
jgi:hypothetical protein